MTTIRDLFDHPDAFNDPNRYLFVTRLPVDAEALRSIGACAVAPSGDAEQALSVLAAEWIQGVYLFPDAQSFDFERNAVELFRDFHEFRILTPRVRGGARAWIAAGGDLRKLDRLRQQGTPASSESAHTNGRLNGRLRFVRASDIEAAEVRWLWEGMVPFDTLTVLEGDPGVGKSTLTASLAAAVSTGRSLTGRRKRTRARHVVMLAAEDHAGNTVVPRLEAAGAALDRVHLVFPGDDLGIASLPGDLGELQRFVRERGAALVVIDPLVAYLDEKHDVNRDQDVRRVLQPLVSMAQNENLAVLGVRHLNKNESAAPIYRGGGSIGIAGAARSQLLMAKDPGPDTGIRVVAQQKINVGPLRRAHRLRIVPDGKVGRIELIGECDYSAADLLQDGTSAERSDLLAEAQAFLAVELADGRLPAKEVIKRAREAGHSERTLSRAKKALGVESNKEAHAWVWSLPSKVAKAQNGRKRGRVGNLDRRGSDQGVSPVRVPTFRQGCQSPGLAPLATFPVTNNGHAP